MAAVSVSLAALWLLNARTGDAPAAPGPVVPASPPSFTLPEAAPWPSGASAPPDPSDVSNLSNPAEPDGGLAVPETPAFRAWETVDESSVDTLRAYKGPAEGRVLVRIQAVDAADGRADGVIHLGRGGGTHVQLLKGRTLNACLSMTSPGYMDGYVVAELMIAFQGGANVLSGGEPA